MGSSHHRRRTISRDFEPRSRWPIERAAPAREKTPPEDGAPAETRESEASAEVGAAAARGKIRPSEEAEETLDEVIRNATAEAEERAVIDAANRAAREENERLAAEAAKARAEEEARLAAEDKVKGEADAIKNTVAAIAGSDVTAAAGKWKEVEALPLQEVGKFKFTDLDRRCSTKLGPGYVRFLGIYPPGMKNKALVGKPVIGVEFSEPVGNANGVLDGNVFFFSAANHASFFPPEEVQLLSGKATDQNIILQKQAEQLDAQLAQLASLGS